MPTAARRGKSGLTPEQKKALDCFLALRSSQQARVQELAGLYNGATDDRERAEIMGVVAEIMFPAPDASTASRLRDEPSSDAAREGTRKHRQYVAEQIRKHRLRMRMTQIDLANKAGLPQSHVSRLERGRHAPTHLTIEKLALAMGLRMSDLDSSYDD